jgi:hypothetical protein
MVRCSSPDTIPSLQRRRAGIVQQMIHLCYSTTRGREARKKMVTSKQSQIRRVAVVWYVFHHPPCLVVTEKPLRLGTHAFHAVLSRKPQCHASLLRSLSFELRQPRYRRYRKRFGGIVQEGQAGLSQIIF